MNMCCSEGVRNTVSISGYRLRFMPASWNSYSKSDTARRPRSTTRAPCLRTKSVSSPENPTTCTFLMSPRISRAMAVRSSSVKNGRFALLSAIASTSVSNSVAARRTRSSMTRVSGSNVPGYTALIIASPFQQLVAHLARARALQLAPRLPGREGLGRLDVHPRAALRLQAAEHRGQHILPEGRIEENHVEALAASLQVRERVVEHELDLPRADGRVRFLQRAENRPILLDHHHARSAARGGFESECAAAGEQIQAREPLE